MPNFSGFLLLFLYIHFRNIVLVTRGGGWKYEFLFSGFPPPPHTHKQTFIWKLIKYILYMMMIIIIIIIIYRIQTYFMCLVHGIKNGKRRGREIQWIKYSSIQFQIFSPLFPPSSVHITFIHFYLSAQCIQKEKNYGPMFCKMGGK